jgi:hypothetical protein
MSDIAKELFKTIVTGTASQEDFSSAIKQKMDQALDVRKAGITAGIYNQQSASSETFEESTDLKEVKDKLLGAAYKALDNAYYWHQVDTSDDSEIVFYWPAEENDQKGSANRNSQPGDLAMYVNKNGTVSGDIPKDRVVQKALDKLRFKKEEANKNQLLVKDLEEASSGDIGKILKFVAKNGAKVKGNVADFGGTKIEFSFDKGKIKFDGGKDSGVEYFDNLRDAISTLSIGMED